MEILTNPSQLQEQFVAALDVGTTKVKCVIVDKTGNVTQVADASVS